MYTFIFNTPLAAFHHKFNDVISFELNSELNTFEITRRVRYETFHGKTAAQVEQEVVKTLGVTCIYVFYHESLIREFII